MRFSPSKSTDTPQTLFAQGHRFICRSNQKHILIYTDGACLNNGQPSATAGCAFVFRPSSSAASINGTVSFRLETQGPSGAVYPQTSNRAELRAVIAALQFRCWYGEGWTQLVIATDSEYVVSGATEWVQSRIGICGSCCYKRYSALKGVCAWCSGVSLGNGIKSQIGGLKRQLPREMAPKNIARFMGFWCDL